jgi:hypothetical protein
MYKHQAFFKLDDFAFKMPFFFFLYMYPGLRLPSLSPSLQSPIRRLLSISATLRRMQLPLQSNGGINQRVVLTLATCDPQPQ